MTTFINLALPPTVPQSVNVFVGTYLAKPKSMITLENHERFEEQEFRDC